MSIYILTLISLVSFIVCTAVLAGSYTDEQVQIIESEAYDDDNDELYSTYSPFQKGVQTVGAIMFLFSVVHATIAAAFMVKEWL